MRMPVDNFFLCGLLDLGDGHVEDQILARERMVEVKTSRCVTDFDDREPHHFAVWLTSVQHRPYHWVRGQLGQGYLHHLRIVPFAIGFAGDNLDDLVVADLKAHHRLFEARNDVAMAVQVPQGFRTLR